MLSARALCVPLLRWVLAVRRRLSGRLWLALMAVALTERPVAIQVRPSIAQYGTPITVRCVVEPNEANRWVVIGIDGFTRSIVQLDKDSRKVTERKFLEPPCGEQVAYCILVQTQNRESRSQQNFIVSCSAF